jgi:hypothetical protein
LIGTRFLVRSYEKEGTMKTVFLLTALGAVLAVPAFAATRDEHEFGLSFSTRAANSKSGVKFFTDRVDYKAPPQGKLADRVASVTFVMAPGTRTNPNAYPSCSAKALEQRGPGACPKGSKVGTGRAEVITGLPLDPIIMSAQVFTTRNGLLTYLTGSGQTQVIGLTMRGNKIVAPVPRKCLIPSDCSQGEAVLKRLSVTLNPGKIVTTPRSCPSSHKWTNTAVYQFVNGDRETETSTSKCKG